MLEKIIDFFKDKKIAILGFGKEGQSTYHFIRKYLKNQYIDILDQKDILLDDNYVNLITGENYLSNLGVYDIIMKTPGITFKDIDTTSFKDKIYSQLELILMFYKKNVIGITGTKGKSTTSTLIYQVLKEQLFDVYLLGNIGIPILDEIEKFSDNTIVVVEMSSHQLEFVNYSPHIGIVLNLFQDHLDHAGSIDHYHEIKMHMFKYQKQGDIGIYASDNEVLRDNVKNNNYKGKLYSVSLDKESDVKLKQNKVMYENDTLYIDDGKRKLIGLHNLENIMFVIFVAKLFNLDLVKAKKTIDSFQGLEHRLEYVGTFKDIIYYNDTIATIPEATIDGVTALKKVDTLIFGGMDRGIDYTPLIEFLASSTVKNLICMPTTGMHIGNILEEKKINKNIVYVDSLEEAVETAKKVTEKGKICLLSPAAPSYEYFKNFEEKGKKYKELVCEK